jgi:poly-beta-1,6-N-acetyl-D-glucosamine N-deacetylase
MRVGLKILMILLSLVALGILTAQVNQDHNVAGETMDDPRYPGEYFYENKVVVLMYHHIDPFFKSGATITPDLFHEQMAMLKEKHFNVIPMKQFDDFQKGKGTVPPNAVVITFDDGYESFYKYAYPELKKWDFTATNFVIVGCTDSPYLSHLPHLNWLEIKEMYANGMTFMSHTYNQHDYVAINPGGFKKPVLLGPSYIEEEARMETQEDYEGRVKQDFALAKKRLEDELGEPQTIICFPYGAYNETVLGIAKSIGIDTFFTIKPGINDGSSHLIYRINGGSPKISEGDLLHSIKHYATQE